MDVKFKVDNEVKQEYLNSKPTGTAKSDIPIIVSADEYESKINKPIYNMTFSELREMIAVKFRNTSLGSITKNISILKTYVDFCIGKKIVVHGENRLAMFTVEEAKKLISKQAFLNRYVTREQIIEYQELLYNDQDKALIGLIFAGIRGRTIKEGTFEEIINLRRRDIDENNNAVILTQNDGAQRTLQVEPSLIQLIIDAYEQEAYIENNGEKTTNVRLSDVRETVINKVEDFVFRIPGKNKFKKVSPTLLNGRMRKYQVWVDNRYMTFNSLYFSGMLNKAIEFYKEKEEVTKEDYLSICEQFNYDTRYFYTIKEIFEKYTEAVDMR